MCAYCVCMWRTEVNVRCLSLLLLTLFLEAGSLAEPGTLLFAQTRWSANLKDPPVSTVPELGLQAHIPGVSCFCDKCFMDNYLSNPAHLSLKQGVPQRARHCKTNKCNPESIDGCWTTSLPSL